MTVPDASWSLNPGALIALAFLAGIYVRRWRTVRRDVGPAAAGGWRLTSWLAGVATLFAALISPVDPLAEQLAIMHMVQHLLLIDVAPILLLAGLTKVILRPVTREIVRLERLAGPLAHPAFGVVAYAGVMLVYHLPPVYDLTLRSGVAHAIAHMAIAFAGGLYWWHLLSPARQRMRMGALGPVAYMVSTKLVVGLLAVGLAFAPEVLYDEYERLPEFWGLTKLQDQNVAGLFMATEQSLIMGIALVALFAKALSDSERDERRRERYGEPAAER